MPTQQQIVSSGRVQPRATAAQTAGAKADAVMYSRESSTPQAKSSVAADLTPTALTNLSPDTSFRSYQDPQNQNGTRRHRLPQAIGDKRLCHDIEPDQLHTLENTSQAVLLDALIAILKLPAPRFAYLS
jgi:hypothetical protein